MSYEKYSENWSELTRDEKSYVLLHPWYADEIKENSRKALKKAQDLFGGGSLHNGAGDAFRHCYWSALLARDIGGDNAQQFTSAHESKLGNPKIEKEMDLYNNGKGIEIGRKNPNALDNVLANMCQNAVLKGELKVIKP